MPNSEPRFYFALPRLITKLRGGSAAPTENNWVETISVGGAVHLLVFIFAAHLLLRGLVLWQQILLLLPLVFLVWIFWLVLIYINSVLIKLLRTRGWLRDVPNSRVQSFLIVTMTTALSGRLLLMETWARVVAGMWIAAVLLNLFATALLAISHANRPAGK